jgi:nitrogen fixation protein NifU and related proteins
MTNEVKGLAKVQALRVVLDFRRMVADGILSEKFPDRLKALGGIHQFPQRVKCATLPWETLVVALHSSPS